MKDFTLMSGVTLPLAPCLVSFAVVEEDSKHLCLLADQA